MNGSVRWNKTFCSCPSAKCRVWTLHTENGVFRAAHSTGSARARLARVKPPCGQGGRGQGEAAAGRARRAPGASTAGCTSLLQEARLFSLGSIVLHPPHPPRRPYGAKGRRPRQEADLPASAGCSWACARALALSRLSFHARNTRADRRERTIQCLAAAASLKPSRTGIISPDPISST